MTLFKYTRADTARKILLDERIRFTQLFALNDPFESHPPVTANITEELMGNAVQTVLENDKILGGVVRETIDKMYSQIPDETRVQLTRQQFEEFVGNIVSLELAKHGISLKKLLLELSMVDTSKMLLAIRNGLVNSVASQLAVLSLSAVSDNQLMWSHYANNHRGVVLGFNSTISFFPEAFEVKYQSQRPTLDILNRPTNNDELKAAVQSICGIKNKDWAYEQEYRVAYPIGVLESTNQTDSAGFPIFVRHFIPIALTMVVFGCRIDQTEREAISALLGLPIYAHVKKYYAVLDTISYRVTITGDHDEQDGDPTRS